MPSSRIFLLLFAFLGITFTFFCISFTFFGISFAFLGISFAFLGISFTLLGISFAFFGISLSISFCWSFCITFRCSFSFSFTFFGISFAFLGISFTFLGISFTLLGIPLSITFFWSVCITFRWSLSFSFSFTLSFFCGSFSASISTISRSFLTSISRSFLTSISGCTFSNSSITSIFNSWTIFGQDFAAISSTCKVIPVFYNLCKPPVHRVHLCDHPVKCLGVHCFKPFVVLCSLAIFYCICMEHIKGFHIQGSILSDHRRIKHQFIIPPLWTGRSEVDGGDND